MWSLLVAVSVTVPCVMAAGAQEEKHDVRTLQRALDREYHLHAGKIPFMGAVSGLSRVMTRGSVRGMRVVTYEQLPGNLDREAVGELVRAHLNAGWSLMVRQHATAANGDDDMVWVQPVGDRVRMLVVSLEANEMDLVQMELSPQALKKWEQEHGG